MDLYNKMKKQKNTTLSE